MLLNEIQRKNAQKKGDWLSLMSCLPEVINAHLLRVDLRAPFPPTVFEVPDEFLLRGLTLNTVATGCLRVRRAGLVMKAVVWIDQSLFYVRESFLIKSWEGVPGILAQVGATRH